MSRLAEVQLAGPAGDLAEAAVELGAERRVGHRRRELGVELLQRRHQRLGHELPAVGAEIPVFGKMFLGHSNLSYTAWPAPWPVAGSRLSGSLNGPVEPSVRPSLPRRARNARGEQERGLSFLGGYCARARPAAAGRDDGEGGKIVIHQFHHPL